jgi:hypothetical protein
MKCWSNLQDSTDASRWKREIPLFESPEEISWWVSKKKEKEKRERELLWYRESRYLCEKKKKRKRKMQKKKWSW